MRLCTVYAGLFLCIAALAACSGNGASSSPPAIASAPSTSPSAASLVVTSSGGSTVTLPAAGGFGGSVTLAAASSGVGSTMAVSAAASVPSGVPSPSSAAHRPKSLGATSILFFVTLTPSANDDFTSYPSFTIAIPANLQASALYVALYDPANAGAGYVPIEGPATIAGPVATFVATPALFRVVAGTPYVFVFYVGGAPSPSPTPVPTTSVTPSASPSSTPSASPAPIATATPLASATPAPVPTQTPGPVVTLAPAPISFAHIINPVLTDPAITLNTAATYTYTQNRSGNGELFVFLPGNQYTPNLYQSVSKWAARSGYHVLAIDYVNTLTPSQDCGLIMNCFAPVYWQTFDGVNRVAQGQVTPGNSIVNRITKMLYYLQANYPQEGWDQFLTTSGPDWTRTVFAGHSQGSAQVASIGQLVRAARIVMFGGPADGVAPGNIWSTIASVTPASAYYGFIHTADFGFATTATSWANFGLGQFGALSGVDGAASPYGLSHQVTTSIASPTPVFPATPDPNWAHRSVAVDSYVPRQADGVTPVWVPVWQYLFGP